jgi:hypothetical protein
VTCLALAVDVGRRDPGVPRARSGRHPQASGRAGRGWVHLDLMGVWHAQTVCQRLGVRMAVHILLARGAALHEVVDPVVLGLLAGLAVVERAAVGRVGAGGDGGGLYLLASGWAGRRRQRGGRGGGSAPAQGEDEDGGKQDSRRLVVLATGELLAP